jgi:hypothetical protein
MGKGLAPTTGCTKPRRQSPPALLPLPSASIGVALAIVRRKNRRPTIFVRQWSVEQCATVLIFRNKSLYIAFASRVPTARVACSSVGIDCYPSSGLSMCCLPSRLPPVRRHPEAGAVSSLRLPPWESRFLLDRARRQSRPERSGFLLAPRAGNTLKSATRAKCHIGL